MELAAELFTPDCQVQYLPDGPGAVWRTPAALVAHFSNDLERVRAGTHLVTNHEVVFRTDDQASIHCCLLSWQRYMSYPDDADRLRLCRYEIEAVRGPSGWRFSRLQLLVDGETVPSRGRDDLRLGEAVRRPWPQSHSRVSP